MDLKEIAKIKNREAATAGAVMGVVLYLIVLVDFLGDLSLKAGYIVSVTNIAIISYLLYYFTCRYGKKIEVTSLTFSQSYGFIILTMLFAGMIYGALYFVQTNYIAPEYYTDLQNQIIINNNAFTDEQKDLAIAGVAFAMKNPFVVIMSAMFSTIFTGAFIGLIVSVFVGRKKVGGNGVSCENSSDGSSDEKMEEENSKK